MRKNNQIYYQISNQISNQTIKTIIKSQFRKTISALLLLVLLLPFLLLPTSTASASDISGADNMEKDTIENELNSEQNNNAEEENQDLDLNKSSNINEENQVEGNIDINDVETSMLETSIVPSSNTVPRVGDVVKGTVRIGSYWMVGEMSYFNVSNFTGDLRGGYAPNPLECLDHTAANPTNVTASYEATVTRVRLTSGYVDYNVVITPPGVTTGERDENGRLLGYQRVGGTIRVDRDFTGSVVISKSSGNVDITDENMAYTLEGAVYGLYNMSDNLVTTIITNERGGGRADNIVLGNYYLKEITPPRGYAIDVESYSSTVEIGETTTLRVADMPIHNPISLIIKKVDGETGENKPQGAASLENAEFTIKYFDDYYENPVIQDIEPTRTWVLKTDEEGMIYLDDHYLVSGDDFYYSLTGETTIPLGTITIEETKAPFGYLVNEEIIIHQITSDDYEEEISVLSVQVIEEDIVRGDVEIFKFTYGLGEVKKPLEGIGFTFKSKTTGEEFKITTDKDGYASTKKLEICERGNLIFDTYIVTESNPNLDYEAIQPFEVVISKEGETIYLDIENKLIEGPTVEKKGGVTIVPKTGDESEELILAAMLLVISLMTISITIGAMVHQKGN